MGERLSIGVAGGGEIHSVARHQVGEFVIRLLYGSDSTRRHHSVPKFTNGPSASEICIRSRKATGEDMKVRLSQLTQDPFYLSFH